MEIPHAPHLDDGGGAGGRYLARASTESLARRHCTSSSMVDECRASSIAGALATACSPASNAAPTGDGSNRGDATAPEADGGQLTDSSASTTEVLLPTTVTDKAGPTEAPPLRPRTRTTMTARARRRCSSTLPGSSISATPPARRPRRSTTRPGPPSTYRTTGASRSHLTKAQRQERAVGTSTAASGGTERHSRCPRRARDNGSSSNSMARTWTAPCT